MDLLHKHLKDLLDYITLAHVQHQLQCTQQLQKQQQQHDLIKQTSANNTNNAGSSSNNNNTYHSNDNNNNIGASAASNVTSGLQLNVGQTSSISNTNLNFNSFMGNQTSLNGSYIGLGSIGNTSKCKICF